MQARADGLYRLRRGREGARHRSLQAQKCIRCLANIFKAGALNAVGYCIDVRNRASQRDTVTIPSRKQRLIVELEHVLGFEGRLCAVQLLLCHPRLAKLGDDGVERGLGLVEGHPGCRYDEEYQSATVETVADILQLAASAIFVSTSCRYSREASSAPTIWASTCRLSASPGAEG